MLKSCVFVSFYIFKRVLRRAMGVSNVYNQAKLNAVAAIKSNLTAKGTKKAADSQKPSYLKLSGSVFDAPGVRDNKPATTLANLNTTASLADLNKRPIARAQGSGSNDNSNPETPSSASEGRAAAAKGEQQADSLRAQASQVQSQQKTVKQFSFGAQKLDASIVKDDKIFTKKLKTQEAEFIKDNQTITKLVKENEEAQKEVDDAQHELDSLLARNSFSMGGSNSTSGSSDDQAKITELQTFIGSKVGIMQANGKVVYSLQRSQKRTLTSMNRTNNQFVKVHKKNTKAINQQQGETNKVIKFAGEVEKYSQLAQVGGQTLQTLGNLMQMAGSTPWTAWMVPVGTVMAKVGTVLELVGNYGMAAANLTKTAAYAAEGNLMGAMQSAAMAIQTGAAAVKGTQNFKKDFAQIDTNANEVLNKNAANKAAKQQVEQMKNSGADFNGMSEKDMRKAISNDLQSQMNGENATLNRADLFKDGQLTDAGKTAAGKSATDVGNEYTSQRGKKGATDKSARKATLNTFKNKASGTKSSTNWADNMNKFTQTMTSFAQMYMMFNGGGSMMGMMGSSMPSMNNMMRFGNSMMGMGNRRYVNNGMGYAGNTSHSTRKRQNPYATRHLTRSARA